MLNRRIFYHFKQLVDKHAPHLDRLLVVIHRKGKAACPILILGRAIAFFRVAAIFIILFRPVLILIFFTIFALLNVLVRDILKLSILFWLTVASGRGTLLVLMVTVMVIAVLSVSMTPTTVYPASVKVTVVRIETMFLRGRSNRGWPALLFGRVISAFMSCTTPMAVATIVHFRVTRISVDTNVVALVVKVIVVVLLLLMIVKAMASLTFIVGMCLCLCHVFRRVTC